MSVSAADLQRFEEGYMLAVKAAPFGACLEENKLLTEDSARVLDFCRKFQLWGMGFQRADVCGALVDAGLDIDAAVGTCLSLGP